MKDPRQNWYVRRNNRVAGPFPAGLISSNILLGRLSEEDLVSHDREEWRPARDIPGLIPDVLRDVLANPDDPEAQARLEAARRWADEKRARAGGEHQEPQGSGEEGAIRAVERHGGRRPWWNYAVLLLLVGFVVAIPFILPEEASQAEPECGASPAPTVNWRNCLLPGRDFANADLTAARAASADLTGATLRAARLADAELSYANLTRAVLRGADLTNATLKGANLRGADLANADLSGADLSYAILTGANLEGAILAEARLEHAEWSEGVVCLPGSVGECRMGRAADEVIAPASDE